MEIKAKDAWGLLLVLLLGQLVAFSMAAASFASSLVANLGTRPSRYFCFIHHLVIIVLNYPSSVLA